MLTLSTRGAWHIHVAVSGRQNWKLLRSIWLLVIGKAGTDGAVNDRAQFYWNQGVGVFWMATGNVDG
ncbi:hypothetical protein BTI_3602 [Burkholderia thailandensis MSMB121]|uniref:hypothetical protein n=1 Tax=Burkholderia humptydooensis TaxID=430531 RepID=UPI000327F60A|nr:hypothetical protein [Burkholderia humptydooensis]AGK49769.1 hypothetical protein BTI_3602 [Burkholderia thailandensis MSMB121]